MIVYQNILKGFIDDVKRNCIEDRIESAYKRRLGRSINNSEKRSWRNSMSFMQRIVDRNGISENCAVLIEYVVPSTSKRVDFIIAGRNVDGAKNFIIIELKQWEYAKSTEKDSIVLTRFRGEVETTHPSYQAYSYKLFLKDFNENVYNGNIIPYSCAYLHNYKEQHPEPLKEEHYKKYVADSPVYFKDDSERLAEFISQHVGKGTGEEILYEIESGRIRPSGKLIDHVCDMFKGNNSFILIDEQKIAYEKALHIASSSKEKRVVIVKGGPGTGKSVISVNLLGGLLQQNMNVAFVAPNAAFRDVMMHSLGRKNKKVRIKHLFKGSASFHKTEKDIYDALIVDEAHRLKNEKAYQYFGDNQVEDIIKSAKVSVFFIDDNQRIRPDDIGTVEEIRRAAEAYNAIVDETELVAQFRCSGMDGYINWLDDILHIQQTANYNGWNKKEFDFQIMDSPHDLKAAIEKKDFNGFKSRILAGYAWPWTKEGNDNSQICDVHIPEFDFKMPWNSRKTGTT